MNRPYALLRTLALGSALLTASGCTDHELLKQELQQAAAKQEQIKTYRFSGHAELALDASLFEGMLPMTAALLSLFKDSRIEYKGAASLEAPIRMEADITVKPKGADAIELPLLLQDNKLYIHIPALNPSGEYLLFPLQESEKLQNTGRLSALLSERLLQGVKPEWIEEAEDTPPADAASKRRIISVTKKNQQEVEAYLSSVLPALLEEMVKNGLGTPAQAQEWTSAAGRLQIQPPGSLALEISKDGYLEGQEGKLFLSTDAHPERQHGITWSYRTTEINQPVGFTREIPAKVKTAEDLMKGLPAPK
ncbi:hypothetical protein PM3016_5532 [Paenibacillus mucilaginosus 3016]|uniref:Lipoprotein n=2 Tax=Paenibacillus mucilaginosus TaxID=61624 RepID=H6NGA1_9BACL|nr:hypothetical protein [Paenibacillus mucilaginosus]AFC32228.1 hypothetical protein PM3016_5532 [Paenibacillus mucilaginosus 3016]AFH64530.1 hypothetical protein B2K_28180 [Paenibacillus mucilaginosus K02]WFA20728.1 hypothetical protein ERY13_27520 [Paenibacillus mucilaginosus]